MKQKQLTILLVVSLATIAQVIPVFATSNPLARAYTIAVWGPTTNSPSYTNWANNTVSNIYNGNTLPNDWRLRTSYFIQGPDETNNTVWFATHIMAANTNYVFSPNSLLFSENSSATPDYFSTGYVYTNNYTYTPQAIGVIWGAGGARVNDTILRSGLWTNKVNEFVFIGHESLYFICSNAGQSNSVDSYFTTVTNNLRITGTFSLNDGTNPVVSASKSFYRQTPPSVPTINIVRTGVQQENISLSNISTNDSWMVQRTPKLLPTTWTDLATLSGGLNSFNWQNGTNKTMFYRAVLE